MTTTNPARLAMRRSEVSGFVRARFGLRGTLGLHRRAIGWDLIRAPINVMLSPVFLLTRLLAAVLNRFGAKRAGAWLSSRKIFLKSNISEQIQADVTALVENMQQQGLGPDVSASTIQRRIASYADTRNAVSEMVTSALVLAAGLILFHQATPGVISLAGPLAEFRAHATAVNDFALGRNLGLAWYWAFPVELSPWYVIATGVLLAVIGSLVTTFAGVLADPVQVATGTHRRRIMRMLDQLDQDQADPGLEREHVFARLGDLSDAAVILWRSLRG